MKSKYDEKVEQLEKAKEELEEEMDDMFLITARQGEMRKAKDGKPFDEDNIGTDLKENEVEIIQFLRPDGRRRRMAAVLGPTYVQMTENLILSAEDLGTGQIAIWARKVGEDEDQDKLKLADNGPGDREPAIVLAELIEEVYHGWGYF